ncbi:MAG: nucleotide exchange factor GrpE [Lachnospiraceae bacterium]|nr:nucleotide exchange factor GrpE [Lachnospiraceae bacterium]
MAEQNVKDLEKDNVCDTETCDETAKNADANAKEATQDSKVEKQACDKADEKKEAEEEKKSSKKKPKKDKKDEKIEELTDRVTRQMAEFENFRKRTEKEKSQMYAMGAKDTLEKILPVVDNFERALAMETEDSPFKEGMDKIYKMFIKNLEEMGVKPLDAAGKPFDPAFHNAVMHIEDENYGENEVVEELQKGYMYKDTILRHSMVKVAN